MALVMYMIAVVLGIVAGALPAYGRGYQPGRQEERALWLATVDRQGLGGNVAKGTPANDDGVHRN